MRIFHRRGVTGLLLVPFAVACALSFSTATASAETPDTQEVHHELEKTFTISPGAISQDPTTRAAVDPPLGGCAAEIGLNVTAYYTNNLLTSVQSIYHGDVLCTTTAAGQTMAHLSTQAHLRVGSSVRNSADLGECSYPPDNTCVYVFSTEIDNCVSILCAGEYWAQNSYSMLLPPGWVWSRWPSYCEILGPEELICLIDTDGNINVSPTLN